MKKLTFLMLALLTCCLLLFVSCDEVGKTPQNTEAPDPCASGHTEHTTAVGYDLAVLERGARMEYKAVLHGIETGDDLALLICLRIAAGCHNNTASSVRLPVDLDLIEALVNDSVEDVKQIGIQTGQNCLGLGVTETCIILDDTRALGGQHQTKVQNALERTALRSHCSHGGLEDGLHAGCSDILGVELIVYKYFTLPNDNYSV